MNGKRGQRVSQLKDIFQVAAPEFVIKGKIIFSTRKILLDCNTSHSKNYCDKFFALGRSIRLLYA